MDQTLFLKHIMPEEGVLSRRKPTDKEWEDMKYGFRMAKKIGGLDIGQTVVVKDMAIMAVEAIEGTDACIKRGGSLGRGPLSQRRPNRPRTIALTCPVSV